MTVYDYDAFLSYDRADEAWVENWLLRGLQKAGLKIATTDDFALGRSRLVNFEHMLDHSRHTLCVLSPAWLKSEWNVFNALLSQSTDLDGMLQRIIPLRCQPCELPRRIAMLEAADFTGPEARWERQFQRVLRDLGVAAQPADRAPESTSPQPQARVEGHATDLEDRPRLPLDTSLHPTRVSRVLSPLAPRMLPTANEMWDSKSEEEKQLRAMQEIIRCADKTLSGPPDVFKVGESLGIEHIKGLRVISQLDIAGYIEYRKLSDKEKKRYLAAFEFENGEVCIPTEKGREFARKGKP